MLPRKLIKGWIIIVLAIMCGTQVYSSPAAVSMPPSFLGLLTQDIKKDYKNFYKEELNASWLLIFMSSGLLANTSFDRTLQQHWQSHLRNSFSDNLATYINDYGVITQYATSLPLYTLLAWLTYPSEAQMSGGTVNQWAYYSLRTLILGAPQQALLTSFLGGSRPFSHSQWKPFTGKRGVSGHAFYGAIPLINAAELSPSTIGSITFYGLSLLPALARVNDNKHYPSQALLGWWLAYASAHSLWHNREGSKANAHFHWVPLMDGIYLGLTTKF